jgi:lysophospholipase L1-like esterase
MNRRTSSLKALFVFTCVLFNAIAPFGQSLSISRHSNTEVWIEGNPASGVLHTLQGSQNFHLWVDITNNLTESFSSVLPYAGISSGFYRLTPSLPEPPPIRLFLVGDSLASECCGWGSGMHNYLKPNASFINYAWPQTSSRTFLDSAEYQMMLLIKPDYAIFQFGWTDESVDQERNVTAEQFRTNLTSLVNTVRGFNGIPILMTIHAVRAWDSTGKLDPWEHPYNSTIRQVAKGMNVHLIDLYPLTVDLYGKLGPIHSEFMRWTAYPNDIIHFSPLGAVWVAQMVANALPDSMGPYLTKILDPPPAP